MDGEITLKTDITMVRKHIWTLCLVIGVIFNSCSRCLMEEFVFINETNHTIEFSIWWAQMEDGVWLGSLERRIVKIPPNSKSQVFAYIYNVSSKKIIPNLHQQNLEGLLGYYHYWQHYGRRGIPVLVDGTECFLFENSGFVLASNYESEVFERDRRIRYTYTFTNVDFEVAKPCEEEE